MTEPRTTTMRARIFGAFGLVVALFLGVSGLALYQMGEMGTLLEITHRHPIQVSNAALRGGRGVSDMRRLSRKLILSRKESEMQLTVTQFHEAAKQVEVSLELIRDNILGEEGRRIYLECQGRWDRWYPKAAAELLELQRLSRDQRLEYSEEGQALLAGRVLQSFDQINRYARNKADEFLLKSKDLRQFNQTLLLLVNGGVLVFALVMVFWLLGSTVTYITRLRNRMAQVSSGGELIEVAVGGATEILEMAANFNLMLGRLREQHQLQQGLTGLYKDISSVASFEQMCASIINIISRETDAVVGALFLADDSQGIFKLSSTFCSGEGRLFRTSFCPGEGPLGQAAIERQALVLTSVQEDDLVLESATGRFTPRVVVIEPLIFEETLVGVIELGFTREPSGRAREYVVQAARVVASFIRTGRLNQTIRDLLTNANKANVELSQKTLELQAQADELRLLADELELQREQVAAADRLKSEFLSNMSHELRTPLNSILALSQLLIARGTGKDQEEEKGLLQVIERNGRNLLNLINDILDLSKIESGWMDISLIEFDPTRTVLDAVATVRPLAEEKGLYLEVERTVLPLMVSDETRFSQILLNLLSNAIKFTERGGVMVRCGADEDQLLVEVEDTGIGISPDFLPYVFDEFRQADGSTTRKYQGTGLGLAICRKLSLLMGGDLTVRSELGKGACFTFRLPLRPRGASALKSLAVLQDPPVSQSGGRVLLIGEHPELTERITRQLIQDGLEVMAVGPEEQSVGDIEAWGPGITLLEVVLPGMAACDLHRSSRLRAILEALPTISLIVDSELARGIALTDCLLMGLPLNWDQVLKELGRLGSKRALRKLLAVGADGERWDEKAGELESLGLVLTMAGSMEEAVRIVEEWPPEVLFLELKAGDPDFWKLIDMARYKPMGPEIVVIALAGPHSDLLNQAGDARIPLPGVPMLDNLLEELGPMIRRLNSPRRSGVTQPQVLVVEDDDIAAEQVGEVLDSMDIIMVRAENGERALALLKGFVPDGVVLDLLMPGIDGFNVLQRLRATPWTEKIPVLVLTAKELTVADKANLKYNRVHQLIQKGAVNREQLKAAIRKLLRTEGALPVPNLRPVELVGPEARSARVLVVEDIPDNMMIMKNILSAVDCQLMTAVTGREAVEKAVAHKPDLILMDIQLPDISGFDAAREIRMSEKLGEVRIVAVTARAMKGDREMVMAAGFDDYLTKPVQPEVLVAAVNRWLGNKGEAE